MDSRTWRWRFCRACGRGNATDTEQCLVARCLAVLLILSAAATSTAGTIRHDVSDTLYTNLAAQPQYDPVGNLSGFGGTLISSRWVLTAAHTSGATQFTVGGNTYNVTQAIVNPEYIPGQAGVGKGKDVALLRLDQPVTNVAPAVRYAGDSSLVGSTATIVGYGWTGTGLTGQSVPPNGKRAGNNVLDALGGASGAGGISPNYIMADFDNPLGSSSNHFGGSLTPLPLEYMLALNDSGGGMFVDVGGVQRLAGVNIFIGGPGSTNADYGDFMGFLRVGVVNDWIDDSIAAKWVNASGGTAGDAANWQIGNSAVGTLLPDQTDILGFNVAGTYTVNFSGASSHDKVLVRNGTVTFDLAGATHSLTSQMQNGSLTVARDNADTASLTLNNGTLAATDAFVGRSAGSTGSVNLSGAGTALNLSESLYLGGNNSAGGGNGTLTVGAGTSVHVAGKLKLWTAGSTLNLNGGTVTVGDLEFAAGTISGTTGGSLTATGVNSTWSGGTISAGAEVNVAAGGVLTIPAIGSRTLNGGTLKNAGTVNWANVNLTGGNGAVINNLATGTFNAQTNASLLFNSSGSTPTFNNAGMFHKTGGTGVAEVQWTFHNSGTVAITTGTMMFSGGYTQSAGKLLLAGGTFASPVAATISGGSIEGTGTINADVLMNGTVSPGASIGSLTFAQDLTMQSGGSLEIELGGTNPGLSFDVVNVGDGFQAGGILKLSFIDGFESLITGGDVFTIVNGNAAITGTFSNALNNQRVLTTDLLGSFVVHYGSGSSYAPDDVVLTNYVPYLPGDFDGDGDVDGADFVSWQTGFPTQFGATLGMGDADGDGDVDGADFVAWQIGFSNPPSPGISAVPEPSAWILGLFSLAAALMVRSRTGHP